MNIRKQKHIAELKVNLKKLKNQKEKLIFPSELQSSKQKKTVI